MNQIELNFEAGLLDQFPEFSQCLKASVYSCGRPFKNIAADLDMSSSRLSRMLNENDDGINFPAHRLDELIQATGDLRPLYWLAEKRGIDPEVKRKQSLERLALLLPEITNLLKSAQGSSE